MKLSASLVLLAVAATVNAIAIADTTPPTVCALEKAPCSLDQDCCASFICEARGGEARWWRWCQPKKQTVCESANRRCQSNSDCCSDQGWKCTPVGGEARFLKFCRKSSA